MIKVSTENGLTEITAHGNAPILLSDLCCINRGVINMIAEDCHEKEFIRGVLKEALIACMDEVEFDSYEAEEE